MDRDRRSDNLIETLYREMYFPLFHYALAVLGEPGLAEEAVQETFAIACMKREALAASRAPRGWLKNVLRNVIRNTQRRRAQLQRLVIASLQYDEGSIVGAADDDHLDAEYSDLLSPGDYRLLKRVVLDRYSMREAAAELGISTEACKKRVQRARDRLRAILQGEGGDDSDEV